MLDFASGSAVCGLAALQSGASSAIANDIDLWAGCAAKMNADLNGIACSWGEEESMDADGDAAQTRAADADHGTAVRCTGVLRTSRSGSSNISSTATSSLSAAAASAGSSTELGALRILDDDIIGTSADAVFGVPAGAAAGPVASPVVLVGDALYDREMGRIVLPWLRELADDGLTVLIGDPGRFVLSEMRGSDTMDGMLELVERYDTPPAVRDVSSGMMSASVWRVKGFS